MSEFKNMSEQSEIVQSKADQGQLSIEAQQTIDSARQGQLLNNSVKHKSSQSSVKKIILFISCSFLVLIFVLSAARLIMSDFDYQNEKQVIKIENKLSQIEIKQNQEKNYQINFLVNTLQQQQQKFQKQLQRRKQLINNLQSLNQKQIKQSQSIQQKIKNNEFNLIKNTKKQVQFKVRNQTSKNFPKIQTQKDHYDLKVSVGKLIQENLKNVININDFHNSPIKKEQFKRAIKLLEIVHNVNYKGQFVFDHFNFYPSPEAKAQALFKVLQEEKQYFDQKYDINKYIHDQIGICVYVPSYNNAKNRLYLRNLDSIFQQEYQNYHVVYVNDASTDGTGEYVKSYMQENEIPVEKYVIINNEKNRGNCANVYNAGHNYCKEGEIMIFLDGDDALIGRQVFALLNAVYQKEKVALTYGQYLFIRQNQIKYGKASKKIPENVLKEGTFRKLKHFYSSHLKTMYVDLFRQIKQTDFQYGNGTFLDTASDVAFMTSAVELAGTRLKYLHQFIYEYRFDTGQNDEVKKQFSVGQTIYNKAPNKKMKNMSFADNPKTVHYDRIKYFLKQIFLPTIQ